MKVVGGPSDGIDVWMGQGKTHVQLIDPPANRMRITAYDYNNYSDRAPVSTLQSYTTYTVRIMSFLRPQQAQRNEDGILDPLIDEYRYLAPSDWSDFKAIQYQFTK